MSKKDLKGYVTTADVRKVMGTIPVRSGAILPLTEYADGKVRLDSDEQYEADLYGNRVGLIGKVLGSLGLDASGERKAQPWGKAIMSTLDAPAGLASSIGQAVTAPARAYRGEIPDGQMIPEGLNFAGSVALGSAAVPRPRASVGMGGKPTEAASHLDMSPEARLARAREMGFDTETTYYRGTNANEVEARPNTWIAEDPAYSNSFASGNGGNVMPIYARGRFMSPGYSKEEAIAAGFDGRRFGDGTVQVFDPKNIRSVNAAFDPAKSSSANLLAANPETSAAPGLGLMAAAKQDQGQRDRPAAINAKRGWAHPKVQAAAQAARKRLGK